MLLTQIIGEVCGPRGKVIQFLLENKDHQNRLVITEQQIADATGITKTSVNSILKILVRCGMIKKRSGNIMVNPMVYMYGKKSKQLALMEQYDRYLDRDIEFKSGIRQTKADA